MLIDLRIVFYTGYVVAMLIVWGLVFRRDWVDFVNDRRDNREELISDGAILISAIAGAVTLATIALGLSMPGIRGFLFALFLGGFLGAGIVKLSLGRRHRP